jgi:replicative DNA helicase
MTAVPHNPEVEEALIGRLLAEPQHTGEVVGALLEPGDFYLAANRLLYGAVVESFYADQPADAMTLGELHAKALSRMWNIDERQAVQRVVALSARPSGRRTCGWGR